MSQTWHKLTRNIQKLSEKNYKAVLKDKKNKQI